MITSPEILLAIGSLLFFIGILATKASNRFGIPVLLLFLIVGIVFGEAGFGIQFNSFSLIQLIGIISLNIILFSGGMDTKYSEIKPVLAPGISLATLGVLLTMILTAVLVYFLTNNLFHAVGFTFLESLLLAAVMSSTDSASVFSILNSRSVNLTSRLRPLLELESGSNDPMAFVMTTLFIQFIQNGGGSGWQFVMTFIFQFVIGALLGVFFGVLVIRFINGINLDNQTFYPLLLICIIFIVFFVTSNLQGNGFLAVYICGLVLGNAKLAHKYSSKKFLDGITWLCQGIMFLALGLLVNPAELLDIAGIGLIISFMLIFVSRPIAVYLCLLPFKKMTKKAKTFIAWVGLRGAVPIIFATYPLTAHLESASKIFNIVFFVTLISLLVQGTTVTIVAQWLGLVKKSEKKTNLSEFEIEMSGEIKSTMSEIVLNNAILEKCKCIMDLPLPDKTLVVMIKRDANYFIPKGTTKMESNDILLLISEDHESMNAAIAKLEHLYGDIKVRKNRKKWDRFFWRWV
jgi:cell volume regulation protein A